MNDEQLLRYSRHLLLDEVGTEVQKRWANAKVAIVGVGGLGSQVAHFLTAAGVGKLCVCDSDTVDLTNLQRQTLYTTADIGKPKVDVACLKLLTINPDIRVRTVHKKLDYNDIRKIAAEADVVVDCTDNYATRHAINRACCDTLTPHVSGAVIRFDGQVTVFNHKNGDSPCYACVFGEDESLEEAKCATMGVFAPLVGTVGTLQAAEVLKLLGDFGQTLDGRLFMINALNTTTQTVKLKKNPKCPVCGK